MGFWQNVSYDRSIPLVPTVVRGSRESKSWHLTVVGTTAYGLFIMLKLRESAGIATI